MNAKLTASLLILAAVLANLAFTALGSDLQLPRRARRAGGRRCSPTSATTRAPSAPGSRSWRCPPRCSLRSRSASGASRRSGPCGSRCRSGSRPPSCRSSACCAGRSSCPATRPTRERRCGLQHGERHPRHGHRRDARLPPHRHVDGRSSSSRSGGATPGAGSRCWARCPRRSCSPASLSPLGLPVIDTANFFGYVLWSVWLIAFAVVILVHERRARRARRRSARRSAVTS